MKRNHNCIVCGEPCKGDFCSEECIAEYADERMAEDDETFDAEYDLPWINQHWT